VASIQITASPVKPLLTRTRPNTRNGAGPVGGWCIRDMIWCREAWGGETQGHSTGSGADEDLGTGGKYTYLAGLQGHTGMHPHQQK
jgi:hypothetical protein